MKNRADVPTSPPIPAERERERSSEDVLASLLQGAAFALHPSATPLAASACLIAVCIDDRHPTLIGRVRVHWTTTEGRGESWVPTLRHIPVRRGDQVLLSQPLNGAEPVVVGVIDGFAHRPMAELTAAAQLELKADEVVRVRDTRGRPLLELRADESGPVLKLVSDGMVLEVGGKLAFRADAIQMEARGGTVEVAATDDIFLKGEVIHLN